MVCRGVLGNIGGSVGSVVGKCDNGGGKVKKSQSKWTSQPQRKLNESCIDS